LHSTKRSKGKKKKEEKEEEEMEATLLKKIQYRIQWEINIQFLTPTKQ
jgi:hypothetical protein